MGVPLLPQAKLQSQEGFELRYLRNRRLAKDYERLKQSAEIMIYIAMTRLMLKRLALVYS
jgi:transposase